MFYSHSCSRARHSCLCILILFEASGYSVTHSMTHSATHSVTHSVAHSAHDSFHILVNFLFCNTFPSCKILLQNKKFCQWQILTAKLHIFKSGKCEICDPIFQYAKCDILGMIFHHAKLMT